MPAVAHEPVVYPPFMSSTLIGPPTWIELAIQKNNLTLSFIFIKLRTEINELQFNRYIQLF